jgi:hypothetical protein
MLAVLSLDSTGVPSAAKEAVTFVLQGLEGLLGRALQVPINNDSPTPNKITAKIAPAVKWRELMGRVWICPVWKDLF